MKQAFKGYFSCCEVWDMDYVWIGGAGGRGGEGCVFIICFFASMDLAGYMDGVVTIHIYVAGYK